MKKKDTLYYPAHLPPCAKCSHKMAVLFVQPECPRCNGWLDDWQETTPTIKLFPLKDTEDGIFIGYGFPSSDWASANRLSAYLYNLYPGLTGTRFEAEFDYAGRTWTVDVYPDSHTFRITVAHKLLPPMSSIAFVELK